MRLYNLIGVITAMAASFLLALVPSLLLPTPRASVHLSETTSAAVIDAVPSKWSAADPERKAATMAKLAKLEDEFDASQDAAAIKAQLIGTWKLLVAEDEDKVMRTGITGAADKSYTSVVGHFQTFSKADPMDVLTGNTNKPLMETVEVVRNEKEGSHSVVAVRGGFQVGSSTLLEADLGVLEIYMKRDVDGAEMDADVAPNRWSCSAVSDTLRVCKLEGGAKRVYAKIDAAEAKAEIDRLKAMAVDVDPDAVWPEDAVVEEDEEEDDPNDDRPLWQKRIDKADGIKRTKNGTPILTGRHS